VEERYDGHEDVWASWQEQWADKDHDFRLELQRARRKGGKKMERKALELREQELDGRCRVERHIELGRLRRYRDFLEREHSPLFLEHCGSFQAPIDLRLDDDDGDDDDVDDDGGEYDDGSDGESDESDGDDDRYYCGGNELKKKTKVTEITMMVMTTRETLTMKVMTRVKKTIVYR
jgi:hypothetical protein